MLAIWWRTRRWNSLGRQSRSQVPPSCRSVANFNWSRIIINDGCLNKAEESRPFRMYIVATAMPAYQKSILFMELGESGILIGDFNLFRTGSSSTWTTSGFRFCGVPVPSNCCSASAPSVGLGGASSSPFGVSVAAAASRSASCAALYSSSACVKASCSCFCFYKYFCFWCLYSSSTFFWNFCHWVANWESSTFNLAAVFPEASSR